MSLPIGFVREWQAGDPPVVKGRSLWEDEAGEVWLAPAEVKALGLTEAMRVALSLRPAGIGLEPVKETRRTSDVRTPDERDASVVSAEEYFEQEDDVESGEETRKALEQAAREAIRPDFTSDAEEAVDKSLDLADLDAARAEHERTGEALSSILARKDRENDEPEATVRADRLAPPSGQVDGWRWWWVCDGGQRWLAYDNRPRVQDGADREVRQGSVPSVVLQAAMLAVWPEDLP